MQELGTLALFIIRMGPPHTLFIPFGARTQHIHTHTHKQIHTRARLMSYLTDKRDRSVIDKFKYEQIRSKIHRV